VGVCAALRLKRCVGDFPVWLESCLGALARGIKELRPGFRWMSGSQFQMRPRLHAGNITPRVHPSLCPPEPAPLSIPPLTPGRHRWIDFAQHDFNATQVPPEWHSWISHIRKDAPTEDPIMQASRPPWQTEAHESLTGTRARYTTYSTTAPKYRAWEPVVAKRGAGASAEHVKAPTAQ
jgi:NADH dehydrogenase (ubiquinone) 1 alpha subcomplex subunit 12/NADH dehydrogenase [ubiquinone] 1 alpha subcomplex assembly factor 2